MNSGDQISSSFKLGLNNAEQVECGNFVTTQEMATFPTQHLPLNTPIFLSLFFFFSPGECKQHST